jgi:hypothetical protein
MRILGRGSAASVISVMLAFARFGAAIAMVIAVVTTLWVLIAGPRGLSVVVPVSYTVDSLSAVLGGRPQWGFEIRTPNTSGEEPTRLKRVEGSLRVPAESRLFVFANGVALLVVLKFVLFVIDQLRAVLRTLIHGNPFDRANGERIRSIGFTVMAGELVWAGIVHAENLYASAHVAIAGVQFDGLPPLSVWTLVYGLIIVVIAEVFRAGTRLDEERSLTI